MGLLIGASTLTLIEIIDLIFYNIFLKYMQTKSNADANTTTTDGGSNHVKSTDENTHISTLIRETAIDGLNEKDAITLSGQAYLKYNTCDDRGYAYPSGMKQDIFKQC